MATEQTMSFRLIPWWKVLVVKAMILRKVLGAIAKLDVRILPEQETITFTYTLFIKK